MIESSTGAGSSAVGVTTERAVIETADSVAGGANIIYHYVLDARPTIRGVT